MPNRTSKSESSDHAPPPAVHLRLVQADVAALSVGSNQRILSWNTAAEALIGIPAAEAIGRRCWAVVRGVGLDGSPICGPECPVTLALRRGEPPASLVLVVGPEHRRRVVAASTLTVAAGGERMTVHTLSELPAPSPSADGLIRGSGARDPLTARQRQILTLLADGLRAGEIARRLELSEATVRNHISSILDRLGCHSQLAAVAEARRRGLV